MRHLLAPSLGALHLLCTLHAASTRYLLFLLLQLVLLLP
jgi:hypothetical protein